MYYDNYDLAFFYIVSYITTDLAIKIPSIVLTSVIYVIYLIIELCSNILVAMSNQKSPKEFKELMDSIFKAFPTIKFTTEIYERVSHVNSEGEDETNLEYVETESEELRILYSRDISGELDLSNGNCSYRIISIAIEIIFADDFSYSDYNNKKKKIKNYKKGYNNNYVHYFYEEINICGLIKKSYLVNLYGNENYFAEKAFYFIFVILTLGQIYKLLFRCMAKPMTYTVRKVISTNHSLNLDGQYKLLEPKLIFPKEVYSFDENVTNQSNEAIKVAISKQEELVNKTLKSKNYILQNDKYKGNNKIFAGKVVEVKNNIESNFNKDLNTITVNNKNNQITNNNNRFNDTYTNLHVDGNIYKK